MPQNARNQLTGFRRGLRAAALWAALGLAAAAAAAAAPPAAAPATSPTLNTAPDPIDYAPEGRTADLPSSTVLAALQRIEERRGKTKSVLAVFDQVRVSEEFGDETKANGKLYVQMPDRLRCEYDKPEPSLILFANNAFYQYAPSLKQVDKFVYATPQEAQAVLKTLMLGFGLSSRAILDSYQVDPVAAGGAEAPPGTFALAFRPLDPQVGRDYSEIRVWFGEQDLSPVEVRLSQVAGDVTTLRIRKIEFDQPLSPELFKPSFPPGTEVIEH